MGTSSSKNPGSSSSSASYTWRNRCIGGPRAFQCSCLGQSSGTYENEIGHEVSDGRNKGDKSLSVDIPPCTEEIKTESNQMKRGKEGKKHSYEVPSISVDVDLDERGRVNTAHNDSRSDISSSQIASIRSLIPSGRSRSRFSFFPGNVSFRLRRAASLGSSSAYSLLPNGLTVSNIEEGFAINTGSTNTLSNGNGPHLDAGVPSVSDINRLPGCQYEDTTSSELQLEQPVSRLPLNLRDNEITSSRNVVRSNENVGFPADLNVQMSRNLTAIETNESRQLERQVRAREPIERSVSFGRTLSVGRLRDRVLRRSLLSDALVGQLQEDREMRDSSQDNTQQFRDDLTRSSDLNENVTQASSIELNSMYSGQEYDLVNLRSRETRYHDIMEHRTDFLERRRRIRSQVRALQRLGSRFENLSGHERSCISSGQHRMGRCTCRTSNQITNPGDDTTARASISRIVMLAEALFEVLDEIHQQSVFLSSRPSVSSIGSVPAPKEVVESMPVKIYTKPEKHQNEDPAQCYICLLEYGEGDCMRILPCRHEFHQMCIDKWLKEIHRVCPLCRGDVCKSDSSAAQS